VPQEPSAQQRLQAVERLLDGAMVAVAPRLLPVVVAGYGSLVLARRLLAGLATAHEVDEVLRALPHNPTTEMDLELWALATRLRTDAASVQALHEHTPDALAAAYREGTLPELLQRELRAFLDRYGFRGVAEIDLGQPRWSETPEHILGSLRNYLDLTDVAQAPAAQFQRGEAAAQAALAMLTERARNKGWLRGHAVRFLLERTRELAGMREVPKALLVECFALARAHLLAIGEQLRREGRLRAADDPFFLSLRELQRALDGEPLGELAAARHKEHEREKARRRVPRVLLSDGTSPEAQAQAGDGKGLVGTAASAGTVSGVARVVLNPIGARVLPGEILVAPSTDPGWTPLFLTASGLVMEMGGAMSHGAVVAREYGIPAVVGVADATLRIRPGQRLTLDGTSGTVTLHDDPPA
jgi:pyruvate,water dikinase